MRYSFAGIVAASLVGALPFLPDFGFVNGFVVARELALVVAADIVILSYAAALLKKKYVAVAVNRPLLIAVFLVLATQLVAAVSGVYFERSFWGNGSFATGLFFFIHLSLFAICIGEMCRTDDWILIRRAVVVSAGMFALLTIIGIEGFGLSTQILWFDLGTRRILFGNETFAGLYLVLAALIGAAEFIREKESSRWRIVVGACLVLISASPILINFKLLIGKIPLSSFTGPETLLGVSRASGTVLIGSCAFLFLWWLCGKLPDAYQDLSRKAVAGASLAAVAIGSALLLTAGSPVQDALFDKTTSARFIVWDATKDAIADRPVFGWGPENYDEAFDRHFDSRLYEREGRIEVWFRNAHNPILDILVREGTFGLLAVALLLAAYVFTLYRARTKGILSQSEALIWIMLSAAHYTQLQTAFNVVPTYILLAVAGGYALYLERDLSEKMLVPARVKNALGIGMLVAAASSLCFVSFSEIPRQAELTRSLGATNLQERISLIQDGTSRTSDFEALHDTANLFVGSVLSELKSEGGRKDRILEYARACLAQYLAAYQKYLEAKPDNYRARLHYAYLLLLSEEWGGTDRSAEALSIAKDSYALSPHNPLSYAIEIMADVYGDDARLAQSKYEEMSELFPEAYLTKDMESWLDVQREIFPEHSFLLISDL